MIFYKAKVKNLKQAIVVQVSVNNFNFFSKKTAFIKVNNSFSFGHSVYIIKNADINILNTKKPIIYNLPQKFFDELEEDDILNILPDGTINILWKKRLNFHDITLFVTNHCNANCIMCPQPPHKDQFSLLNTNKLLIKYLKKQPIKKIGVTGGEPTTKEYDLLTLLELSYKYYPNTKIDLLTNAKKLSDFSFAKKIALTNPNINFCISFPTDNMDDFNKIMGANIYNDILEAIQNLALLKQNIELRIVILKQNYKRLENISEFIFRNFPFVNHIVFMGMEIIGNAFNNIDIIDVNPNVYSVELFNSIKFLNRRDMNVSIYNIPYCLIDQSLWRFVRNSISRWKQSYLAECNLCIKKNTCPGIFSTSRIIDKDTIKAIL
jgi:His-Xaa-Ser system radical SAM maturase HxsC